MKNQSSIKHILFALGLTLAVSIGLGVAGSSTKSANAASTNCFTICFRSPQHYLLSPQRIIRTPVLIAGENYNNPTSDLAAIHFALRGAGVFSTPSPTKLLNQQFVAAQLSLAVAGGLGSGTTFSALNGQLSCYGLPTAPVTLSTGATINSNSTLGDLFAETRDAITDNRVADFTPLATILGQLYTPVSVSYCP